MAFNTRCAGVVLLSLVALGFAGCAEDNEAAKEAKVTSGTGTQPVRTQADYAKQRAAGGVGTTKANNYPGAAK